MKVTKKLPNFFSQMEVNRPMGVEHEFDNFMQKKNVDEKVGVKRNISSAIHILSNPKGLISFSI